MIIIKLADGSYTKITNTDYATLESNGVVDIDRKPKNKYNYKNRIILFISSNKDGITIGKIVNRFRPADKITITKLVDELENEGKIRSVYSIKMYDGKEVRTLFKVATI